MADTSVSPDSRETDNNIGNTRSSSTTRGTSSSSINFFKKKRKGSRPFAAFTNQDKLRYIEMLESGQKATKICNEHNIPKSTLSTWIKARASIRAAIECGKANGCRQRKTKNDSLDGALVDWFNEMESVNAAVSGQMIFEKASELAIELESGGISKSWIERWKKRNGICGQEIYGNSKAGKIFYRRSIEDIDSSVAVIEISTIEGETSVDTPQSYKLHTSAVLSELEPGEEGSEDTEESNSRVKKQPLHVDLYVDADRKRKEREKCVEAITAVLSKPNADVLTELKKVISKIDKRFGTQDSLELSTGSVKDLSLDDPVRKLMQSAMDMRKKAYCPYSNFRVGAAVITPDESIYSGCNVENASYGLTMCAERVAIGNAVSSGSREFTHMAVCCDVKGSFKGPCGACRQVLVEFGTDWTLYCVRPNGKFKQVSVDELLPMGFHPSALQEARV